jgi:intracellular sulfur oxidation DsrE/DsrF family protein
VRRCDLSVIRQTFDDLVRQGVEPDTVLAFRGPAATLVSRIASGSMKPILMPSTRSPITADLDMLGVRMEGCGVTTRLFQVDNNTLLDGIKPVGNIFVSLIGYQARGYAVIPIY